MFRISRNKVSTLVGFRFKKFGLDALLSQDFCYLQFGFKKIYWLAVCKKKPPLILSSVGFKLKINSKFFKCGTLKKTLKLWRDVYENRTRNGSRASGVQSRAVVRL